MTSITPTTQVSGLVSGLDTSSIISQLMQIEAEPQTALKNTVTADQAQVTTYQSLNTKFQALVTAAQAVQASTNWGARTASSSDSSVSASATSGALASSLQFSVTQLATAQSMISGSATGSLTDTSSFTYSGTGNSFQIVGSDGTATTITPTDGSLQSVITAVNNSNAGVRATAVQVAAGQYRLQLSGTSTGAASAFTVSGLDGLGGESTVTAAQDAQIHIGSATTGFDVTSATNTFTGVQPGLTFTVSQPGVTATVSVGNDSTTIAANVKALVDAANAVLSEISTDTAAGTVNSDGTTTGTGALAGDTEIKGMTSSIIEAVTSAVGGKSAATIGIQSKSDGTLTFDEDTFTAAYKADPVGTQNLLSPSTGDGVADRLLAVANAASDPVTGSITSSIASTNSTISTLNDQISDWDVRLADKQTSLNAQFTAMEVSLQKLQSESSWLSAQIAQLPGGTSSSSSSSKASTS